MEAVAGRARRVGLPESLEAVGVSPELLPALASQALADPCHADNPRPCAEEDLLALYEAAHAGAPVLA